MRTIEWCGYEWITQERWGQVHPDKKYWWYDESCVSIDESGDLHLLTKKNLKTFPETGISQIGVGLVSCTHKFGYGVYSINAKLPEGNNLWPAFWMWSWDSWPPEIDIFEGYSSKRGRYFRPTIKNPIGFWNVQTNVHYKKEDKNKMSGGRTHFFGFKNPSKNFIDYTLIWQRDSIEFYYNKRLVRTINDKEILNQLSNTKMNVIINNGITDSVDLINGIPESDFVIRNFKYSPITYGK